MASFHHHHHHPSPHHCHNPIPTTPTTSCCCFTSNCNSNNHPSPSPPPPPPQPDPLLHSLATLLQQYQSPNLYTSHSISKPHNHPNHAQRSHFQPQKVKFQHPTEHQEHDQLDTHFFLSSLLQRISTLEHNLQQFSISNKHSHSVREAAARVIQTHFRAFLVGRSRTLSQLKDLAFIKSSFNNLKSSTLNKAQFNYALVSHKVMNLLLKLDSVQGCDPMIRDGKKSISRDIVRFLDYIDELAGKRHVTLNKPVRNVRFLRNNCKTRDLNSDDLSRKQKELVDNLSARVEKIRGFSKVCDNDEEDVELEGFQQFVEDDDDEDVDGNVQVLNVRNGILIKPYGGKPRVKKSVSFDEDGNMYRVFSDSHESVLSGDGSFTDGSDSSDDHVESAGAKNDEVAEEEISTVTQSSDGNRNAVRNSRGGEYYEMNVQCHDQDGNLVFAAPMPLKMESRADLMKKRKAVKIVT